MHVRFGVDANINTVDDPILNIFFFSTCARSNEFDDARRKKRDIRDQAKKEWSQWDKLNEICWLLLLRVIKSLSVCDDNEKKKKKQIRRRKFLIVERNYIRETIYMTYPL